MVCHAKVLPGMTVYAHGKRGIRRWLGSRLAERARRRRHETYRALPLIQHLPLRVRCRLWRFGVSSAPSEDVRLLDAGELRSLFPDAIIVRERIGPPTKSLIAVGPRETGEQE
jgi:hypothetical protein